MKMTSELLCCLADTQQCTYQLASKEKKKINKPPTAYDLMGIYMYMHVHVQMPAHVHVLVAVSFY